MGYNVIISVERHKNRMNRPLLITGAGGFLGSRICEYYSNRDGYEAVGVTHRELDIEDFVAVSAFIKAIRPAYVQMCIRDRYGKSGKLTLDIYLNSHKIIRRKRL